MTEALLTVPEVAFLAALPKSPSHYDPRFHHQAALDRRNWVISQMEENGYITDSQAKAFHAEPLITRAKTDTVANRRLVFSRLRDRDAVQKLFNEIGPRFNARPGGYTRILKMGFRVGDNAPMAYVELVDRPEVSDASAEQKAD